MEEDSPLPPETAFLNVAAVTCATTCLGPGLRSVVWVQGCAFQCPGCIAPDWIPIQPARLVAPEELVDELLANPLVSGLTFSGGEPMLQAHGLAHLARLARQKRELSIICFTGFIYDQLVRQQPLPGVNELLAEVDVLIDGPYIARLNDNQGLRGSRNQKIHYLTGRLSNQRLDQSPRKSEIRIDGGHVMMVGVPPLGMEQAFQKAVQQANQMKCELLTL